jgi:hypothetical protein
MAVVEASASIPTATPAQPVAPVWRELWSLLRLALFQRVRAGDITGNELTIGLLAVIAVASWIVADPLLHSRELVFSWHALPDLVCVAGAVFALAWLLDRVARPRAGYRRVLLVTMGAVPLVMLGELASWKLPASWLSALIVALAVYALLYFAHGLRVLTGRHQPVALLLGAMWVALFLFSFDYVQANPRFWVRADERLDRLHAVGATGVRMSRALFLQQARIDAAIARMPAQDPGVVDRYFLGFAGYGQERIFAREIELATAAVGRYFQTGDRSLRLVNDGADLERWPVATEPGLRHALARLGEVMGDEDVLFLALASHGDRGRGVRITNPGMLATTLSPESLAGMLRDSGIGWRVIVVSACYSGSFVDALADERSIVIAAAAPDRKSFGCNDSRELTYFGEAFFRDALSRAGSLRAAFESARAALAAKERASGILPSLPQASFGDLIEPRLEANLEADALASRK